MSGRRGSAGLAVCRVLTAPLAVLGELEPVAGVGLVLGRHVVAALAHLASQRDRRPLVGWHGSCFLIPREPGWRARCPPPDRSEERRVGKECRPGSSSSQTEMWCSREPVAD